MRCTWWLRRSRWCKRCIILLMIMMTFLLYAGHTAIKRSRCSEEDSRNLLLELCELYNGGQVAGSLCSALCRDKQIHYDHCTNYREGKKVFFMTCDNVCEKDEHVKVVFKTKTDLRRRERLSKTFLSNSVEDLGLFKGFIDDMIQSTFYNDIGVNITDYADRLTFAWGTHYDKYIMNNKDKKDVNFIAAESIMSLILQSEYSLMRYLTDKNYVPAIYGTCGPAYFVEFTETLSSYEHTIVSNPFFTWKERVNIALRLIDLIHEIETDLHLPLHLCDVKMDNFGLRYKSQISLIDVDCALFEDKLHQQFRFSNCTSHDDCDFFDCRGFCDTATQKCLETRTNNNMQSVCEDVFIGLSTKFSTGLLRDPPQHSKKEVIEALSDCAYPTGSTKRHTTRGPASKESIENLKEVLKNSLIT